jgi:hypothetical protein
VEEGTGVNDGVNVAVGRLVLVAEGGTGELVAVKVEVGGSVRLGVAVLKLGMLVTPGVLVGTFGTQSTCPT